MPAYFYIVVLISVLGTGTGSASRFIEADTTGWCPPELKCTVAGSRAGNFVFLYFRRRFLSANVTNKGRILSEMRSNILGLATFTIQQPLLNLSVTMLTSGINPCGFDFFVASSEFRSRLVSTAKATRCQNWCFFARSRCMTSTLNIENRSRESPSPTISSSTPIPLPTTTPSNQLLSSSVTSVAEKSKTAGNQKFLNVQTNWCSNSSSVSSCAVSATIDRKNISLIFDWNYSSSRKEAQSSLQSIFDNMNLSSSLSPLQVLADQIFARPQFPPCTFNVTSAVKIFQTYLSNSSFTCTRCVVATLPCEEKEEEERLHPLLTALATPELKVFGALLRNTNLLDIVLSLSEVTLFAPTDLAFSAAARLFLPGFPGRGLEALNVLKRVAVLVDGQGRIEPEQFLLSLAFYQTVKGSIYSSDLVGEPRLIETTLGVPLLSSGLGELVDVSKRTRNALVLKSMSGRGGKFVLHVLDAVPFAFDFQIDSKIAICAYSNRSSLQSL